MYYASKSIYKMKTFYKFYGPSWASIVILLLLQFPIFGQEKLVINDQDYFEMPGVTIMVFDDYYPAGHQSGVTIIQNDVRVAANGDLQSGRASKVGEKRQIKKQE